MIHLTVRALISALDNPNDAFWLAQTHFMTHQYSRAERLLTRPFPLSPPPDTPFPPHLHPQIYPPGTFSSTSSVPITNGAAYSHPSQRRPQRGRGKDPASVHVHPHSQSQAAMDPMRIPIQYPDIYHNQLAGLTVEIGGVDGEADMSRLVDMSIACRYLAAQCQVCKTVSTPSSKWGKRGSRRAASMSLELWLRRRSL